MYRYSNCHVTSTGPIVTSRIDHSFARRQAVGVSIYEPLVTHHAASLSYSTATLHFTTTLSELNSERQSPLKSHDVVYLPSAQAV